MTNTRNGSFLDCKECYGHGLNPSADPRCKYGCGRFMTYPPYMTRRVKSTTTDIPVTDLENVNTTTASFYEEILFNLKPTADGVLTINPLKEASLRYKHLILLIGLFVGVTVTVIGYIFYRRIGWHNTTKISNASSNIAIVMRDV